MYEAILKKLENSKIVPVVKINDASNAASLAKALIAGGLPVAEITFRTAAAASAIKEMSQIDGMFVGAGTITNVEQAKQAVACGAQFLVTAGFNPKVADYSAENKIPLFPGACTPTELMMLLEYNLPVAKFFPASNFGGIDTIKALSAPFPNLKFMPTGGVSTSNIKDYLAVPQIIACGGSWMVSEKLIDEKNFDEITRLTKEAVDLIK